MDKVLITATTPYMIRQFLLGDIDLLQKMGYEVEVGTNFKTFNLLSDKILSDLKDELTAKGVKINQISFTNKLLDFKTLRKSYLECIELINKNNYKLIHTHTPFAGFITRIAYRNSTCFPQTKMVYTAHGFHFFKGNNILINTLFKGIERFAGRFTDALITINTEDYNAACQFKLKPGGTVYKIPGVGVDIDHIASIQRNKKGLCDKLGIPEDSYLIVSVGELRKLKNHEMVIRALPSLPDHVHYVICGSGTLKEHLEEVAEQLGVGHRVHLLGFCTNVVEIVKSCDLFIFPSHREGLPVSLMEAIAAEIPCLASNVRGNSDLLENYKNCLFEVNNDSELLEKIHSQMKNPVIVQKSDYQKYDKKNVQSQMKNIYMKCLKSDLHDN